MARVSDLLIAVVLIAMAVPLMVIVALAIKFDSPGPVLLKREQWGSPAHHSNRCVSLLDADRQPAAALQCAVRRPDNRRHRTAPPRLSRLTASSSPIVTNRSSGYDEGEGRPGEHLYRFGEIQAALFQGCRRYLAGLGNGRDRHHHRVRRTPRRDGSILAVAWAPRTRTHTDARHAGRYFSGCWQIPRQLFFSRSGGIRR